MTNERNSANMACYRTIWLSDTHLGYRGCKAEHLLQFLQTTECDTLYLVGDIIDFWNMKKNLYWPQTHNAVVRTLLNKALSGTRIIYIPGNHDETIRNSGRFNLGNIEVLPEAVHITHTGKRLLVTHGDQFDSAVKCNALLSFIGFHAYEVLVYANVAYNYGRRVLGFPYWSLANYVKARIKNAREFIEQFENAVIHEADRREFDGVVCGHIHHANVRVERNITYYNTGDWIESCTAITENREGQLTLHRINDAGVLSGVETDYITGSAEAA